MAKSKISTNQSKISTCTSFITSTNTSLSTSIQNSHSTMFTYNAMCSNSTGFAQHSIHSIVTTSPLRHSILQVTRGTDDH